MSETAAEVVEEVARTMLTTIDNPWNPFTHYDEWRVWDEDAGYFTNGLLARICKSSDDMSEPDQALAIRQAQEEIVEFNLSGVHRLVTREM